MDAVGSNAQGTAARRIWVGRPSTVIAFAAVMAGPVLLVILIGVVSGRATGGPLPLLALGLVGLCLMALVGFLPRSIRVDCEGITITRWLWGRSFTPAAHVQGIRIVGCDETPSAIFIERSSGGPVAIGAVGDLLREAADLAPALRSRFGEPPAMVSLRTEMRSPEAALMGRSGFAASAKPLGRWRIIASAVCIAATVATAVSWRELWGFLVHVDPGPGWTTLVGAYVVLIVVAVGCLSLLDLARGGPIRSLRVDDRGVTFARLLWATCLPPERVLGVAVSSTLVRGRPRTTVGIRWRGRFVRRVVTLRADRFDTAPGLLAGALLARFGEWTPPRRSGPQRSKEDEKPEHPSASAV